MKVDFNAKQREFVAYIRNPEANPAPADVAEQRMAMYRELFFNNIENFLSSNFPVIRKLLDDQQWLALAQDFFANHTCESPYFSEIPEEFIGFLQQERNHQDDFPFLVELAHYEWVEMALSIAKEELVVNSLPIADLSTKSLQVSPLAWPLAYQYPVHKIAPNFLPLTPPESATFLIVYRDLHDDVVFLEITPMTYRLLAIIQEQPTAVAAEVLAQIIAEMQHPQPQLIIDGGLQILNGLAEKNIITVVE